MKSTSNTIGSTIMTVVGLFWIILAILLIDDSAVRAMFMMGGAAFVVFGVMQLSAGSKKK